MLTAKTAKNKIVAIKEAAVEQMSHVTANEKIAGAAVIGVAVGAAAAAIGSTLLHRSASDQDTEVAKAGANTASKKD
jgi:hypothetical protein